MMIRTTKFSTSDHTNCTTIFWVCKSQNQINETLFTRNICAKSGSHQVKPKDLINSNKNWNIWFYSQQVLKIKMFDRGRQFRMRVFLCSKTRIYYTNKVFNLDSILWLKPRLLQPLYLLDAVFKSLELSTAVQLSTLPPLIKFNLPSFIRLRFSTTSYMVSNLSNLT